MTPDSILASIAGLFSILLAFAGIVRKRRSLSRWFYFVGMIGLAAESVFSRFASRMQGFRRSPSSRLRSISFRGSGCALA